MTAASDFDVTEARSMFRHRIDSLEGDVARCFWPLTAANAPGCAFFPAAMYAFATIDYFSSFWAGWNKSSKDRDQTVRLAEFMQKYMFYPSRESVIAIHFWRHKLMHTAEPRGLTSTKTGEHYKWALADQSCSHMTLEPIDPPGTLQLAFSPPQSAADLREGVFGPSGNFHELRTTKTLQGHFVACRTELSKYTIDV